MAKRTVMRSSKGKKLYAVRDKEGQFKDIQQYSRAHASDVKRSSKAEKKAPKSYLGLGFLRWGVLLHRTARIHRRL